MDVFGDTSVGGGSTKELLVSGTSMTDSAQSDTIKIVTTMTMPSTTPLGGTYTLNADFEKGTLAGVGIPGDLLYPPEEVLRWTRASGADYRALSSTSGHDAFLLETDAVGTILAEALGVEPVEPVRLVPPRMQPSAFSVME